MRDLSAATKKMLDGLSPRGRNEFYRTYYRLNRTSGPGPFTVYCGSRASHRGHVWNGEGGKLNCPGKAYPS